MKPIMIMSLFLNVICMYGWYRETTLGYMLVHAMITGCLVGYLFYLIIKGDVK
jgi:hypothetical protein